MSFAHHQEGEIIAPFPDIDIYVCVYIYIYTYTHTHTHTLCADFFFPLTEHFWDWCPVENTLGKSDPASYVTSQTGSGRPRQGKSGGTEDPSPVLCLLPQGSFHSTTPLTSTPRSSLCFHETLACFPIWKCHWAPGKAENVYFLCKIPRIRQSVSGTSLVVQWLTICLPVQGTQVRSLVLEDPTCCGATKPVRHNY